MVIKENIKQIFIFDMLSVHSTIHCKESEYFLLDSALPDNSLRQG